MSPTPPSPRCRGYATEAARACCELGFGELGLERIVGRAAVDNRASIAVLRKCGMRFVERRVLHGMQAELYELTAARWAEARG